MSIHNFASFGELASFLGTRMDAVSEMQKHALEVCASQIEEDAKAKIGHYQGAVGPFNAWRELAEATKAERVMLGFTENDPLLRTGAMRDSITHQVDEGMAAVGSDSEIAVDQELGTDRIPPRPFLGPAAFNAEGFVVGQVKEWTVAALSGLDI